MLWKDERIVAIDIETTGLDPEKDKIVELGTAVMKQGQILLRHGRLINPGIPIPKEATSIHGIQDKDVKDAPKFSDVTQKFIDHIQKADALVAYNWPFDAAFLEKEIGDAWKWIVSKKPIIDPLVVIRLGTVGRYWKGTGRHKLENVAERFNIKVEGEAHSTAADCEMTLLVLNALMTHLPDDGYEATEMIKRCREVQDRNYKRWKSIRRMKMAEKPTNTEIDRAIDTIQRLIRYIEETEPHATRTIEHLRIGETELYINKTEEEEKG